MLNTLYYYLGYDIKEDSKYEVNNEPTFKENLVENIISGDILNQINSINEKGYHEYFKQIKEDKAKKNN